MVYHETLFYVVGCVDGGSTTAMVGNNGCLSEAARVHDCHNVLAAGFCDMWG